MDFPTLGGHVLKKWPAHCHGRLYTRAVDFKAPQGCTILNLRADLRECAWEGGLDSPWGEGGCKLPRPGGPLGNKFKAGRCVNLAGVTGHTWCFVLCTPKYQK